MEIVFLASDKCEVSVVIRRVDLSESARGIAFYAGACGGF